VSMNSTRSPRGISDPLLHSPWVHPPPFTSAQAQRSTRLMGVPFLPPLHRPLLRSPRLFHSPSAPSPPASCLTLPQLRGRRSRRTASTPCFFTYSNATLRQPRASQQTVSWRAAGNMDLATPPPPAWLAMLVSVMIWAVIHAVQAGYNVLFRQPLLFTLARALYLCNCVSIFIPCLPFLSPPPGPPHPAVLSLLPSSTMITS
jgi:hypothetical protein